MTKISELIAGAIDRLVRSVVVPVTGAIPFLVSSGILLVAYGCLWLGFGAALAVNPGVLDDVWRSIGQQPLPVQLIGWLLAMPLMVGLWMWDMNWPLVVRLLLIAGMAGWNLLVFVPRRGRARQAAVGS